jgi:hypothetical protein
MELLPPRARHTTVGPPAGSRRCGQTRRLHPRRTARNTDSPWCFRVAYARAYCSRPNAMGSRVLVIPPTGDMPAFDAAPTDTPACALRMPAYTFGACQRRPPPPVVRNLATWRASRLRASSARLLKTAPTNHAGALQTHALGTPHRSPMTRVGAVYLLRYGTSIRGAAKLRIGMTLAF